MNLTLYTVVHPIPPDNPWGAAEGWRWAIHTDANFHQADQGCINASWQPSQADAQSELSMVLLSIRRAFTAAGGTATVVGSVLAHCPLTADVVGELVQVLA